MYPPLPQSMKVRLRSRTYDTASAMASPLFSQFGIVEFLGNTGSYSDSLFGLYKAAIIHRARLTLRLVNMGAEPLILAVSPLPASWIGSTPTLSELLDQPKAVRKTCGSSTAQDKCVVVTNASAKEVLGKDYILSRYEMSQAQAASSTPLFPDETVWTVAVSAFNALTAVSFRLEIEMEYDVEFYELDSS